MNNKEIDLKLNTNSFLFYMQSTNSFLTFLEGQKRNNTIKAFLKLLITMQMSYANPKSYCQNRGKIGNILN